MARSYVGNVVTSAALPFSASQFEKVARLLNYMHVPFISKTTFWNLKMSFPGLESHGILS